MARAFFGIQTLAGWIRGQVVGPVVLDQSVTGMDGIVGAKICVVLVLDYLDLSKRQESNFS